MHPGKNFRRNGLSPTVKPDRRASVLQSYKCPALPQIFHFLFFFRQQPESQDFLLQSLYILSTLILYVLPLLHMSHESYDLPARGIPLNEGTVLSFSPNEEPSTTDSILSEGLCKTEPSCSTRHRTMSQMSDGYRISPEAAPAPPCVTHATSGANPSMWSFSFCKRLSGIKTGRYTFSTPVSLKRLSRSD